MPLGRRRTWSLGASAGTLGSMLLWSDDRLDLAIAVRDDVRAGIVRWGVPGAVNLVGALSVPGLLTKGDVDLHLCIPADGFRVGVEVLGRHLTPTEEAAWSATLRVFAAPERDDVPVGLAVTPHASEHDLRFRTAWQHLRESAALRTRYNDVKRAAAGTARYETAKSAFFNELEMQTRVAGPLGGRVCPADP